MAFTNFIPKFWAEKINRENDKLLVLAGLCNREYEGAIKKKGDTVHILGIGGATIGDYAGTDIGAPEIVTDSKISLVIDKSKFFNVAIDDVDKRQAVGGVLDAILAECNEGMSEVEDSDIAAKIVAEAGNKPTAVANLKTAGVRKTLRKALTTLQKNGVKKATNVVAVIDPDVLEILEGEVENLRTANDGIVTNGYSGKTSGIEIYVSNNLPPKTMFVFTKGRSVAHAKQLNEVEAYRPQGLFSDAVKGLSCYGTKVCKSNEVVLITYTALE